MKAYRERVTKMNFENRAMAPAFTKTVAVATACCFLLSFVFGQAVAETLELRSEGQRFDRIFDELAVPHTAGRVTGAKYYGSGEVVVAIQDLHCHAEVQKNISAVLALLDRRYGISKVYLEGASGDVDTSWLGGIQDRDLRGRMADSLLAQGKLTGAEYYSVTAEKPGLIRGLEDRELYERNLRRLSAILDKQAETERLLAQFERDLEQVKGQYLNERQEKLERASEKYGEGGIEAKKYYKLLEKYSERLKIDIRGYRNLVRYRKLMDDEGRLDYRRTAREMQGFVASLRRTLPLAEFTALMRETENFSRADQLYVYLTRLTRDSPRALLAAYPDLALFFEYIELNGKIDPVSLVREERKLVRDLCDRLADNQSERDAAFLSDFFRCYRDYFGNRISSEDLEYFRENLPRFELLWAKYVDNDGLASLAPRAALLDEFYRANLERNECFARNLLGRAPAPAAAPATPFADDTARALAALGQASDVKVVVTGGFHTAGLSRLLDDRRITHLVITPNVTGDVRAADEVYGRLAREQSAFVSQAFALLALSQNPEPEKVKAAIAETLVPLFIEQKLPWSEIARRVNALLAENPALGNAAFAAQEGEHGDARCLLRVTYGSPQSPAVREFAFEYRNGELASVSPGDGGLPGGDILYDFYRSGKAEDPSSWRGIVRNVLYYLGEPFLGAPVWETLAFPLLGASFLGLGWATFGFAFAHTVAEWAARAKDRGKGESLLAAVAGRKALAADARDLAIRLVVSAGLVAPFLLISSPLLAAGVSVSLHSLYNLLAARFPGKLPLFAIFRPGRAATDVTSQVRALGITDGFDGQTLSGIPLADWAKQHALFTELSPHQYYADYEHKEFRVLMDNARRGYRTLSWVESYVLGYARSIGEEARTRRWMNDLKKAALEARRKNARIKQVDYLTGKYGPHRLQHTDSPLEWAAKGRIFRQEQEKRAGRLFARHDMSGMRLKDMPVWPLDGEGRLDIALLSWMKNRNEVPPPAYWSAKKASLAELLAREEEEARASEKAEGVQLSLFDQPEVAADLQEPAARKEPAPGDKVLFLVDKVTVGEVTAVQRRARETRVAVRHPDGTREEYEAGELQVISGEEYARYLAESRADDLYVREDISDKELAAVGKAIDRLFDTSERYGTSEKLELSRRIRARYLFSSAERRRKIESFVFSHLEKRLSARRTLPSDNEIRAQGYVVFRPLAPEQLKGFLNSFYEGTVSVFRSPENGAALLVLSRELPEEAMMIFGGFAPVFGHNHPRNSTVEPSGDDQRSIDSLVSGGDEISEAELILCLVSGRLEMYLAEKGREVRLAGDENVIPELVRLGVVRPDRGNGGRKALSGPGAGLAADNAGADDTAGTARASSPDARRISFSNRLGMAAFSALGGWALSTLVLSSPLGWLVGAPLAAVYVLHALLIARAELKRGPPAAGRKEKVFSLVRKALAGGLAPARVVEGEIRIDEELMAALPSWMQVAVIRHEQRHLVFPREHPTLAKVPLLEEILVSLFAYADLFPVLRERYFNAFVRRAGAPGKKSLSDPSLQLDLLHALGVAQSLSRVEVKIDPNYPRNATKIEGKTVTFFLKGSPGDLYPGEVAGALARNPEIARETKRVVSGAGQWMVEPAGFRTLDRNGPLADWLIDVTDFQAINVILPRRLGGGGDLGVVTGLAKTLKEMYPGKTVRLLLHNNSLPGAVSSGFIRGFDLDGPEAQEIDGITYVNLNDKTRGLFRKYSQPNDINIHFAAVSEDKEILRYPKEMYGNPEAVNLLLADPGMEIEIMAREKFRLGFLEPWPYFAEGGKVKYPGALGLFPPTEPFIRQVRELGVDTGKKRDELLTALQLDRSLAGRRWGVAYALESGSYETYLTLFRQAFLDNDGLREQGTVLFMATGGNKKNEEVILQRAREYGFRVTRVPKEGPPSVAVERGGLNKADIVVFDFLPHDVFEKVFILADDLPSLVRGAVTLSHQYYISSITGRPFFFDSAPWQGSLSMDLREVGGASLKDDVQKYMQHAFQLSPHLLKPGDIPKAAGVFYDPEARAVFQRFTSLSLKEFSFKERLAAVLQSVWTKRLDEAMSPVLKAVSGLRRERGMAVTTETQPLEYTGKNVPSARIAARTARGVPLEIRDKLFPDGEVYVRIMNQEKVKGAAVDVEVSINSCDDLVEAVLLAHALRLYGARKIRLILDKPVSIDNGLDIVLGYCGDELFYRDSGGLKKLEIAPLATPRRDKSPYHIDRVLFQHARLEQDARDAASSINSPADRVEIDKNGSDPFKWTIQVPPGLERENVVLIHSTENNRDFVELWMMLVALRKAGVASISFVNLHEGYSRQDKIFNPGESLSAVTMLRLVNTFVDYHLGLNIHYADNSGAIEKDGYRVYNLNAFVQVAEKMLDVVAAQAGPVGLERELRDHPIVLVSPDDGSAGYVSEAASVLEKYISDTYGVTTKVHWAYMDKHRVSSTEVKITGQLLEAEGKPFAGVEDVSRCRAFILDDETSQGSTLLSCTYALVRKNGFAWQRVFSGVVHGKLARGLAPFETGWRAAEKERAELPKPEFINDAKETMPPAFFVTTESVALPAGFPESNKASIGLVIRYAVTSIIKTMPKERVRFAQNTLRDLVYNTFWTLMENLRDAIVRAARRSMQVPADTSRSVLRWVYTFFELDEDVTAKYLGLLDRKLAAEGTGTASLLKGEGIDLVEISRVLNGDDAYSFTAMEILKQKKKKLILHPEPLRRLLRRLPARDFSVGEFLRLSARYELYKNEALNVKASPVYEAFTRYLEVKQLDPREARTAAHLHRFITYLRDLRTLDGLGEYVERTARETGKPVFRVEEFVSELVRQADLIDYFESAAPSPRGRPQALGLTRQELLARAQDEVLRHFSFLTVAEELQTAAILLVESLYSDVEQLHGNRLRLLRSARARVYRTEIKALRRALAARGEELAALGVRQAKDGIEIRTVRGELMPAGLHGAELGYATAEVVRGRLIVYVTEGFWKASRSPRAPPALFALLARHELQELTAFRVPRSAPYEDFKRYRALNNAPKDFASFHQYLMEADPEQKALIEFAGTAAGGRIAALLDAGESRIGKAKRPAAAAEPSVIDREKLAAMVERFFSGTRYTAPDILLGRPFSRKAVAAFGKVVSDLRKAVPGEVLSVIDPKFFHITVAAEGYQQTVDPLPPEAVEKARGWMAGRVAEGGAAFTGSLAGELKLMPDGVIILEITDPGMIEGVRRIRSLFAGGECYIPRIVHVTVGRLRTLDYSPEDIRKIEAVLEAHNRAGTMGVSFTVDRLRFGQFTEQGQEELYASYLPLAGAPARPGIRSILAEVFRKLKPLNPSGIPAAAARAPGTPALLPELEGRQVVEVSLAPDTEKLSALQARGARAFAVSVTDRRRGTPIGNVTVPAVDREGRAVENVNVEVYLERLTAADGGRVPVLRLFRPGAFAADGARQLDLPLLLGRGALAVISELHENPVMRRKAQGLAGRVFEESVPVVIEMRGPAAALARPEVFLDENNRNALFRDTAFVYDAGTGAPAFLAADGPLSGRLDTGSFLVRDAVRDGALDLTRLGMMAADAVTGDREALAAYPGLKGLLAVKVPFAQGGTELAGYLGAVYRDPLRRKAAESVSGARTNLSVTLPLSALRKNANDPGAGKFTDLAPFFGSDLKPMGVGTVLLTGVLKTAGESFETAESAMALSEDGIDWAPELSRLGLDPSKAAAPEDETEWVHWDELRERELALAREAYRAFTKKGGARARAFEAFARENASWLDGYAEFAALARLLAGGAPGEWRAEEIAQARADARFKEYAGLYRYRQWVAYGQLQAALAAIHEQGGKVLFDYPLFRARGSAEAFARPDYFAARPAAGNAKSDAPLPWNWARLAQDDYRPVLDPVRHWLARGFDGLRFGALPSVYGRTADRSGDEPGEAFTARLKAAVDAADPKAIVVARAPEGGESSLRDAYGFMTIEELGDLLPGARVTEGTWLEIDGPGASRPQDDERYRSRFGMGNDESSFEKLFEDLFRSGAAFVSFTLGTQWGDALPAGRHYRIPREGNDARRRFDMARRIRTLAALGSPATRAAYFEKGYRAAFGYREFPRLDGEDWAGLGKTEKLALRAGDAAENIEAPGLHCLLSAYERTLSGGEKGAEIFRQNGDALFGTVYDVLSRVPGLGPDAWPDGWSYLRSLEKDARVRQSREEQALCSAQLAGFARGVLERALEARYVAAGGVLQADAADRDAFRALLLAADSRGVAPAPGEETEPPALALSGPAAPLAGIIGAAGKTVPLEVRQRLLAGSSGAPLDLVDAAVRARAALELREQQGWSLTRIESEVRGMLGPVLAKIASSGTLPRDPALGPARAAEEQWALSELLRILSLFADRPLLSGPEALEQPAATAVETVRQMLGAA